MTAAVAGAVISVEKCEEIMTIPAKSFQMFFSGFIGITTAAFFLVVFSTCQVSANFKNADADSEVKQMVDETFSLVDSLVRAGHPDTIAYLDSSAQTSTELKIKNLFQKYTAISYYYSKYSKNYALAETYADSTLQLFKKNQYATDYDMLHLYAILIKGDTQLHQHIYGTAIQYFIEGWYLINPKETPCIAVEYLRRLGNISYQQENYRSSIDFYSRSWQLSANCATYTNFLWFKRTYWHYHHLASNYRKLQMPDSALYYSQWALALLLKAESPVRFSKNTNHRHFLEMEKGVTYGNMGTSSKELGHEEKAVRFWEMSIAINERSGYANEHAELIRLRLANYYLEAGRLEDTETELALTREWLDKNSSETVELRWWHLRWKWLARTGNHAQEYAAYRQYAKLEEASLKNKVGISAVDITAQMRLSEQQHEIGRLKRESELHKMYLMAAVAGSLLAIFILFLIWRYWKQSKKKVQDLADLSKQVFKHKLQLEKSNKTITRIMNIMAHDLRNPLIGIEWISLTLLQDNNLMDERKKNIGLMHESSVQALEIIDEVMNSNVLGVHENKYESFKKEFTDLRPYLKHCMKVLQLRASKKGQIIELDDFEEGITVSLNRSTMFRVIGNLIENAIKFSHKDSKIRLNVENFNDTVLLSVQDYGIGIPGDLKEKIFDTLTEAKRHGTSGEPSFGMGLSISRQIVEAHGGSIWIESEEEKGTAVYIELPVAEQHSEVK